MSFLKTPYPPVTRGKIVLWGMMASMPFGGMIWQVYHYLVALRRLGFDVWYVEDSDRYLYDLRTHVPTTEYADNLALLANCMDRVGLADRWIFRPPGAADRCLGAEDFKGLLRLYREAVAAINLCGAQEPRTYHESLSCRIYLETDPVENQVAVASGRQKVIRRLDAHDYHFSYGENLGSADCPVPIERYEWQATRPPVCVDFWWDTAKPVTSRCLRTIASLSHDNNDKGWISSKDVVWQEHIWRWSKRDEFFKFLDIPSRASMPVEVALGSVDKPDRVTIQSSGWRTRDAASLDDPEEYRRYIVDSAGEFTVAKDQYVSPRSGWFSDRSVCYLAAGRPVITQDTGFSKFIPTGNGLLAYSNVDQALAAIESLASDYSRHAAAALDIAREYFGAERVVSAMLAKAGIL